MDGDADIVKKSGPYLTKFLKKELFFMIDPFNVTWENESCFFILDKKVQGSEQSIPSYHSLNIGQNRGT